MQLTGGDESTPLSLEEFDRLMSDVLRHVPAKLAVAVSGGGDSMALVLLLDDWCRRRDVKFFALTVDHGLREISEQEAHQVGEWLDAHNINHQILTWVGHKPDANIQDEARGARYRLMTAWCHKQNIDHLFLAHHKNDQAETFLIRLLRGSGVDGLAAMEPCAPVPTSGLIASNLKIYRPLLDINKSRLLALLKEQDQPWLEDPSNQQLKYKRVQVRELLENNDIEGLEVDRIAATAARMKRVRSYLEQETDGAESDYVEYDPFGFARLNSQFSENLHEEIALRLLARVLKKVGGYHYPPRLSKLEMLYHSLKDGAFSGQTLLGSQLLKAADNRIIFVRESARIAPSQPIDKGEKLLWDNRFVIDGVEEQGEIVPLGINIQTRMEGEREGFRAGLNKYLGAPALRDRIVPSLPVIMTSSGVLKLPDFLLKALEISDLDGFSAVFKE